MGPWLDHDDGVLMNGSQDSNMSCMILEPQSCFFETNKCFLLTKVIAAKVIWSTGSGRAFLRKGLQNWGFYILAHLQSQLLWIWIATTSSSFFFTSRGLIWPWPPLWKTQFKGSIPQVQTLELTPEDEQEVNKQGRWEITVGKLLLVIIK